MKIPRNDSLQQLVDVEDRGKGGDILGAIS